MIVLLISLIWCSRLVYSSHVDGFSHFCGFCFLSVFLAFFLFFLVFFFKSWRVEIFLLHISMRGVVLTMLVFSFPLTGLFLWVYGLFAVCAVC